MKRYNTITLFLIYTCLTTWSIRSFDREIELGKADNWQDLISYELVLTREGKWGYQDLVLKDAQQELNTDTDLLLHFDSAVTEDESGHYSIGGGPQFISSKTKVFGNGSNAFQGKRNRLELTPWASSEQGERPAPAAWASSEQGERPAPREKALFTPGALWSDFSLEFWLQPLTLTNGENLLSWNGSLQAEGEIRQQIFSCSLAERKVVWEFENFFLSPSGGKTLFRLQSLKGLLPGKWSHHLLRFDSNTGLLEYLINGIPEAILYATDNGKENDAVNLPYIGEVATGNLNIGSFYTGLMDELHLRGSFISNLTTSRYTPNPGKVISKVYNLEYSSSLVKQIDAVYSKPGDSEVYFYYKFAPEMDSWNTLAGDWIQFSPGKPLPGEVKGKYFQFMLELYPSGDQEVSPAVSSLKFIYQPDLPPSPPSALNASAGNGSVILTWNKVNEYDIAGYLIYYGQRSRTYTGDDGLPGPSPIDAGNKTHFEITNLTNGKLYYFAVIAYDSSTPPHKSLFSLEISARPSVLFK